MRILKEETGAIIIDVQERLLPHMEKENELIGNLKILIEGLKVLGIPFTVCEQYKKGLGPTKLEISKLISDFNPIQKISFSGCDERAFREDIIKKAKKHFIVAGIESHVCVQQTVIDLLAMGLVPVVIEDCVSSRKANDKKLAIERMRQEGAIITTYEAILFELCRYAGNDVFKQISKLVK